MCILKSILNRKDVLFLIFGYILLLLGFGACFRAIRDSLPPPAILNNKIVGYTQYFGYPFYIDSIIFFIFTVYPILYFIVLSKIRKNKK